MKRHEHGFNSQSCELIGPFYGSTMPSIKNFSWALCEPMIAFEESLLEISTELTAPTDKL
jgi:hypothetical protein